MPRATGISIDDLFLNNEAKHITERFDGMIQVGTKRAAYDNALRRIQRHLHKWGKVVDPANVISILAFVHVANRGEEIAQAKGADTPAIWRRIKARVESFVP